MMVAWSVVTALDSPTMSPPARMTVVEVSRACAAES
jgi:hypothetical protein